MPGCARVRAPAGASIRRVTQLYFPTAPAALCARRGATAPSRVSSDACVHVVRAAHARRARRMRAAARH
jgi:hypothetical protein